MEQRAGRLAVSGCNVRTPSLRRLSKTDVVALTAVSALALALRFTFVSVVHPTPVSDFAWYYNHAVQLTQGLGFTTNGVQTAYWPPGWPYFLAGVFFIFGPHVYAGELAQSVLNSATCALVFLIALRAAGTAAAITAAVLYAVLPSNIEWSAVLGSEPLYTLLWLFAIYIWISVRPTQLGWFALSGVVLGAASLVRPTALLGWGILLLYLWIRQGKYDFRTVVLPPLAVLLLMSATIAPDLIRNYRIFHTFVLICNTGGTTLLIGNNPYYIAGDVSLHNARLQKMTDDPRTELLADQTAERMAFSYIRTHPRETAARVLPKLWTLYARDDGAIHYTFGNDASPDFIRNVTSSNRAIYYLILALALVGFLACVRGFTKGTDTGRIWIMLLLNILYNTLPFVIAPAYDRYHFSTMPFLAVFAGIGAIAAYSLRTHRTRLRT